jgi:5-oxoprolinase (ATP-hydrolysing) subunit C
MIEVLSCGALCSVQDLGRDHHLRYGVGTAGAMDRLALTIGNLMLGNPVGAAGIEVAVFPFKVRLLQDLAFAVTGAGRSAELDGRPVPPWWTQQGHKGQVLTLSHSTFGDNRGARSYLLVAGGLDVPVVLGSRSTQLRGQLGGYEGRSLRPGDILHCVAGNATAPDSGGPGPHENSTGFGVLPPEEALPWRSFCSSSADADANVATAVRVVPAAEYREFAEASIDTFWSAAWKVSAQSDRYGYRLAGPTLPLRQTMETRSHGIVPGVIQVPHGGQPIIQMRDAQPTGGYPKIGTVIEADLWRLGQTPAGSRIRFVQISYEQAVAALDKNEAYLKRINRLIDLYRQTAA